MRKEKSKVITKTCKMCKKSFTVPEYYIRIHGDRPFCSNSCFKRYRQFKGLLDAASKNEKNKNNNKIKELVGW